MDILIPVACAQGPMADYFTQAPKFSLERPLRVCNTAPHETFGLSCLTKHVSCTVCSPHRRADINGHAVAERRLIAKISTD